MVHDFLNRCKPEDVFVFLVVLLTFVGILTIFLAIQWRRICLAEMEAVLKQDMLNRGMSADEIRTVLETPMAAARTGCAEKRVVIGSHGDSVVIEGHRSSR
jgi:hypothetical protein